MKKLYVVFRGRVQGVGFRYTVDRLARHFDVTGFVKNLPDGNVELVAEGEEAVLQDFLQAILESPMKHNIRDRNVEWLAASGRYTEFGIAI